MTEHKYRQLSKRYQRVIEGLSMKLTRDSIERQDLQSEGTVAILSCSEAEEKYLGRKIKIAMIDYLRRNNGKFRPDFFPISEKSSQRLFQILTEYYPN